MIEPLRPMSTGQLLDHTFALYRRNFVLFVGIATVGPLANVIFQLLAVGTNVASPFVPRRATANGLTFGWLGLGGVFFGYIILLAGMAISHAATVKAVAAVYLGRETSIGGAYKALRGRILSLFGTLILIFLIMLAAFIPVGILMSMVFLAIGLIARSSHNPVAEVVVTVTVMVFIFAIMVAYVAIFARYALAIQACIVESFGPRASLKRSAALSKGSRGRVVIIYLVFLLLGAILGGGLGAIAGGVGALLHNKIAAALLIYLAGFIAGSLTGPLATIGISLLYYDERVRKEAFDLQLMMSSLDTPGIAGAAPAPSPAQI